MPSIRPDVTFIHANRADARGNVLIEGIAGVQKEAALAAKRVVVTVEEVVKRLEASHNACVLPRSVVNAIAVVPGGAHPSYAHGYYGRDNAAFLDWDRIAADRDVFHAWMDEHVMRAGPEVFAARAALMRGKI